MMRWISIGEEISISPNSTPIQTSSNGEVDINRRISISPTQQHQYTRAVMVRWISIGRGIFDILQLNNTNTRVPRR